MNTSGFILYFSVAGWVLSCFFFSKAATAVLLWPMLVVWTFLKFFSEA
jgi:hypothetical protein